MTALLDLPCQPRERALAYGFFASVAARPLTSEALASLRSAAARTGGAEGVGFAAGLMADPALAPEGPDLRLPLARDHALLFLGIAEGHGPPPPYASLWRSDDRTGSASVSMARFFSAAGAAPHLTVGPGDHISDLMEFMGWLATAAEERTLADAVDRQRRFLDDHLLSWVPAWTAAVEAAARQSFYRTWAGLLSDFLRADAEFLGSLP